MNMLTDLRKNIFWEIFIFSMLGIADDYIRECDEFLKLVATV